MRNFAASAQQKHFLNLYSVFEKASSHVTTTEDNDGMMNNGCDNWSCVAHELIAYFSTAQHVTRRWRLQCKHVHTYRSIVLVSASMHLCSTLAWIVHCTTERRVLRAEHMKYVETNNCRKRTRRVFTACDYRKHRAFFFFGKHE